MHRFRYTVSRVNARRSLLNGTSPTDEVRPIAVMQSQFSRNLDFHVLVVQVCSLLFSIHACMHAPATLRSHVW